MSTAVGECAISGGIRKAYTWKFKAGIIGIHCDVKKFNPYGNLQDPGDPLLTMTDLLPHLAQSQDEKPLGKAIEGEQLNLLIGSRPLSGSEGADRLKRSLLKLFYEE